MVTFMKTLLRYFSLAKYFLKINIQCGLEYPSYLISWLISNPLQFFFGIITVKVIITNFHALEGWSFEQIAFLYGLGIISHGLSVVFFIQTWYIDYMITDGEFDRLMVRPLNVFFQFCFKDFNFVGITDMLPGLVIFIYGCIASGFSFTVINIIKILLVIIGATALRGAIYTISGSLAFWTKRSGILTSVYLTLFTYTTQYPVSIFPRLIQDLLTFILPLAFISYFPSSEFFGIDTGYRFMGSLSVWTFGVGIAFYLLSMTVFKIGLRRYESCGS
ncbi:MAG: ABC transporter permease [Firmicutes bacterium HGW-Firmicutes-21]|nr:MAG: ABC transporter permease [Firmicutes bacterium HGW-Firmicutes-21]